MSWGHNLFIGSCLSLHHRVFCTEYFTILISNYHVDYKANIELDFEL